MADAPPGAPTAAAWLTSSSVTPAPRPGRLERRAGAPKPPTPTPERARAMTRSVLPLRPAPCTGITGARSTTTCQYLVLGAAWPLAYDRLHWARRPGTPAPSRRALSPHARFHATPPNTGLQLRGPDLHKRIPRSPADKGVCPSTKRPRQLQALVGPLLAACEFISVGRR